MADETDQGGVSKEENPTPGGHTAAPVPAGAAASPPSQPLPPAAPQKKDISADIAAILKDVPLPERREIRLPAERPRQQEVKPIDELLAHASLETTPLTPSTPNEYPEVVQEPEREDTVVALRTFKDDLKSVTRNQKVSVVHALALEEERRSGKARVSDERTPRPDRVRPVLFAVVLLFLLGGSALGGVYVAMRYQAAPLPVRENDSLVFAENSVAFPLENKPSKSLRDQLGAERLNTSASLGSITRIVPLASVTSPDGTAQARLATLSEFFSALDMHPPEMLVRSLGDDFFLGVHTVDENAPFLVIPVLSFEQAFAGMLEWEARINTDLAPFFTPLPTLSRGPDGIPVQRPFNDVIMRNYDVRAMRDDQGEIQLYYSFPTRGILIIAESPYTFAEVLTRLRARAQIQ